MKNENVVRLILQNGVRIGVSKTTSAILIEKEGAREDHRGPWHYENLDKTCAEVEAAQTSEERRSAIERSLRRVGKRLKETRR